MEFEMYKFIEETRKSLLLIIKNQKLIMAKQDQFNELLTRMDAATTEIANDLKTLREEAAAGSISDASLATLDAKIAQLEAMGQDPADPIPDPVVEPGEDTEEPV